MEGLPEEVVLHIFDFLDIVTLSSLRLISTKWRSLADDASLWQKVLMKSFPLQVGQRWMWKIQKTSPDLEVFDYGYSARHVKISSRQEKADGLHPAICVGGELDNDSSEYWEVIINDIARRSIVGVGVAAMGVRMNDLLWDEFGGAYYSDGCTGHSGVLAMSYEPYQKGDVIGVLQWSCAEEATVSRSVLMHQHLKKRAKL
ncbi:hypothetical protein PROFUN_04906 [Planoprotostelium fungivorum]|uniref:F-box domain-containing protein n=1 Tax=Planoprotostelium fungivorum TaxID=1890364 RepID=A0A2P6NF90_9EUKA|nr:hypothetical protein PROFUN_04906 [Planoprotostelium fungivorum]